MKDEEALREFVTARLGSLSKVAYLLTGDHHAAEDLLQNTLLVVATKWQRVNAADDPTAYVRRILYHELVSGWRRSRYLRAERTAAAIPDQPGVRDEADDAVQRLMLRNALARLAPRQRAVIVLRFYENLTEPEAARALGCSVGTVKSQTHDAISRLRALAPELAGLVNQPMEVPSP